MPAVLVNVDRAVGLGPDAVAESRPSRRRSGNSRSDLDLLFITRGTIHMPSRASLS